MLRKKWRVWMDVGWELIGWEGGGLVSLGVRVVEWWSGAGGFIALIKNSERLSGGGWFWVGGVCGRLDYLLDVPIMDLCGVGGGGREQGCEGEPFEVQWPQNPEGRTKENPQKNV
ncbi:hypothetical protein Tco_0377834 [Tanacetum coccineum]